LSWELLLLLGSALLLAVVGWGSWLLRRNVTRSLVRLAAVDPETIPALAEECRATVRERLRVDLDPQSPLESAAALDGLVLEGRLRPLFRVPGYEMRYAECVGAFLGEMVRSHASAEWRADPISPKLVVFRPGGAVEAHPFLKAVRHHTHGRPGELRAWVAALVEEGGRDG
jgi:hypothetical protein